MNFIANRRFADYYVIRNSKTMKKHGKTRYSRKTHEFLAMSLTHISIQFYPLKKTEKNKSKTMKKHGKTQKHESLNYDFWSWNSKNKNDIDFGTEIPST